MTCLSIGTNGSLSTAIVRLGLLGLIGLLGATASCTDHDDAAVGTVALNLVGQAPSGAMYRLRHAVITVTGEGTTRIWNTDDTALDQTSLSDNVAIGDYSASVAPGWSLERLEGGTATPVAAALVSKNPASFAVSVHQRTVVSLRFRLATEQLDMGQGYGIVLGVAESPLQMLVVSHEIGFEPAISVFPVSERGDVAPLRTITGEATTLRGADGITVANDEIVVCDPSDSAIDFFPLRANGDIAPTRSISGSHTGLDRCFDVAVVGDELYVVQFNDLLVFPASAEGDVPPIRRLSGFQVGQYLAIDSNELYVTDQNAAGVFVFSLPFADEAPPVRFLASPCATGVAVGDGELFVVDGCAANINVYPQTAQGNVAPLRTIAGPNTGLLGPVGMKRFNHELYVADVNVDNIWIFPDTAAGDPAPVTLLGGPNHTVVNPSGVAVH